MKWLCRLMKHSGHRRWRLFRKEGPKNTFVRWCERCQINLNEYKSTYEGIKTGEYILGDAPEK